MKSVLNVLLAFCIILGLSQCDDNITTDPDAKTGNAQFEMTDAPTDDPNVEGVFITVAEVKVDGETYEGFEGKQTIDIMAYQNGNTKVLGLSELEAKSYNNISIVLDYETDADGNSPGCYVLTTDNMKYDLAAETNETETELLVAKNFEVQENETTNIVLDFDLRKSIKYADDNSQSEYSFVTEAELDAALRPIEKESASNVEGEYSDNMSNSDKVVVYAYAKGTFDQDMETEGQGESEILFKNATTSATVDANGQYQLSFLEEGEYEIHIASYKDTDNDGKLELDALLNVSLLGGINTNEFTVNGGVDLNLNLSIGGMIIL